MSDFYVEQATSSHHLTLHHNASHYDTSLTFTCQNNYTAPHHTTPQHHTTTEHHITLKSYECSLHLARIVSARSDKGSEKKRGLKSRTASIKQVCEELEPTWNRLASAVSFSMYFLYSSMVVAPMHLTILRLNSVTVK